MTGPELLAVALGMRHGVDPDHLAAVDGLSRVRPSPLKGFLFALGHGGIVTLGRPEKEAHLARVGNLPGSRRPPLPSPSGRRGVGL